MLLLILSFFLSLLSLHLEYKFPKVLKKLLTIMPTALKKSAATTKLLAHYARFPPTALSLAQMAQFGRKPTTATVFRASQFMADELPVRLAHKVHELENLPEPLAQTQSIQRVLSWYVQSFEDITKMVKYVKENIPTDVKTELLESSSQSLAIPSSLDPDLAAEQYLIRRKHAEASKLSSEQDKPEKSILGSIRDRILNGLTSPLAKYDGDQRWPREVYDYLTLFSECLTSVRKRHDAVVTTMAQGIRDYGTTLQGTNKDKYSTEVFEQDIQSFLDRFFMSRIGIRMLIGQQLALMEGKFAKDYVGIICTHTNIKETIGHATQLAQQICEDWYGMYEAPKVIIECNENLRYMYIPAHLSHMIFEVVKNSLRAVVERYGTDLEASKYPPITIVVGDGSEDFTIRISDKGGGIPRSVQKRVWLYNYTTVKDAPDIDPEFSEPMMNAPMAGFGYGLPITRLYARYFGGDVILQSIEGYGTDVYMHLNKLSTRELIY